MMVLSVRRMQVNGSTFSVKIAVVTHARDSSTQIMNHYRLILGTVGRIKQQAWERKEIEVKIRKDFQERNEEQMSPF